MTVIAAGRFRRTPAERADQQYSWQRPDQAFFAAGACHVLAWACQALHPAEDVDVVAMHLAGDVRAFHVYACWRGLAFDHAGWNEVAALQEANAAFEGRPVDCRIVDVPLPEFCAQHGYRLPAAFWQDPTPRAHAFVAAHVPPWTTQAHL